VEGLTDAMLNEMLDLGHGITGLALNLEETASSTASSRSAGSRPFWRAMPSRTMRISWLPRAWISGERLRLHHSSNACWGWIISEKSIPGRAAHGERGHERRHRKSGALCSRGDAQGRCKDWGGNPAGDRGVRVNGSNQPQAGAGQGAVRHWHHRSGAAGGPVQILGRVEKQRGGCVPVHLAAPDGPRPQRQL
jgi:hypothetical protein